MYLHVEHLGRMQAAKNTVIHDSYCDTTEHWIRKQKAWGFIAGLLLVDFLANDLPHLSNVGVELDDS